MKPPGLQQPVRPPGSAPGRRPAAVLRLPRLLTLLVLVGCSTSPSAPPASSYVMLLPSPDGSVGQVQVRGSKGVQLLDQAYQASGLDGGSAPQGLSPGRVLRDLAATMAARPVLPTHYMLYFQLGSTQLLPESAALLEQIRADVAGRASAELIITGRTDGLGGGSEANALLSQQRAQVVATQLQLQDLRVDRLVVQAQGPRDLQTGTPNDGRAEPRNRRVEVTVR